MQSKMPVASVVRFHIIFTLHEKMFPFLLVVERYWLNYILK